MSDTYQTVAKVGEILEGEGKPFEVNGRAIALILDEGNYYAIDDACPHQGAPLSEGTIMEKTVSCSWHGWRFSLEDGRWIDSPKSKVCIATYPVRVEGDEIQVLVESS